MHSSEDRLPLRPTNGNGISAPDLRQLVSLPGSSRDLSRPQEQGNTKKKRSSIIYQQPVEELPQEPDEPEEPERRAYGDPSKIAQYFPELGNS